MRTLAPPSRRLAFLLSRFLRVCPEAPLSSHQKQKVNGTTTAIALQNVAFEIQDVNPEIYPLFTKRLGFLGSSRAGDILHLLEHR